MTGNSRPYILVSNVPAGENEVVRFVDVYSLVSIVCLFVAELFTNILLAAKDLIDGDVLFFVISVCCLILSGLILTTFTIWWYKNDEELNNLTVSTGRRILRMILLISLLAPLLRNLEALYFATKSHHCHGEKRRHYYSLMKRFMAHAAMLSVFKGFMESGPDVVLHLLEFFQSQASDPNKYAQSDIFRMIAVFIHLVLMSATYASYEHSKQLDDKDNRRQQNILRMLLLTVWRFFDITSRVLALSLFASAFPYYLLIICIVHFIAMFLWIRYMDTKIYDKKYKEYIFNIMLAEIFVFFFFNPKKENSRRRYAIYYILIFLENTALMCVWYHYSSPKADFTVPVFIVQFLCFFVAQILMIVYFSIMYNPHGHQKAIDNLTCMLSNSTCDLQ